jgi:hypothetical protein
MMSAQKRAVLIAEKPTFRVDVGIHDLLMGGPKPAPLLPRGKPVTLPEPVFPTFPKLGSEQESDGTRILGCFPEDHEFGLEGGHPLCLQQEVTEIPIATPAAE